MIIWSSNTQYIKNSIFLSPPSPLLPFSPSPLLPFSPSPLLPFPPLLPPGFLNTIPTFESNKMSEENVSIIFGPLIIGQGAPSANGMPPDVSGPAAVVAAMLGCYSKFMFGEEGTSEGWVKKYIKE